MPFERDIRTGKASFSFINFMAVLVVSGCFVYFFWISIPPKMEINENRNIGEVKTVLIAAFMLVLGFYFGSSKAVQSKDTKIEELQQSATDIAAASLKTKEETKVETINTENISGNVTAETLNTKAE